MSDPMRDAMAKALTENGISEGVDGLHGWRCAHPDIYGPCTCVGELLDDLAAALAPLIEARVREARAEELTEAAIAAREMHDPPEPECLEWADWLLARATRVRRG